MKVFCYGSNMNTLRITERCSGANFISTAKVIGWKLVFNKISKDGSGKANLIPFKKLREFRNNPSKFNH